MAPAVYWAMTSSFTHVVSPETATSHRWMRPRTNPDPARRISGANVIARLPGALAQTPTWREQGVDVVFSSWRALIGPRGMSAEQVAYWEALMAKVSADDEWRRELEQNALTPAYANAEATRKIFAQQAEQLRAILADLGLAR